MDDRSRLARFRTFAGAYPPRAAVGDAWSEHRRYVGFAAALFGFGVAIGALLALAGYNLLELLVELVGEDPFPDAEETDLTARFFIANNSLPFVLSIVGAVTLGVYTAWIMVFNGILVGNVGVAVGQAVGFDYILVGLLPHGVFELPALFVAAGVGFRLLHRFAQRVRGTREAFLTKPYLYRTGLFVLVGWLALAVAAVVEAHVTGALLEALFGERLEALEGAANESSERVAAGVSAILRG